jgi:hypothetical protein
MTAYNESVKISLGPDPVSEISKDLLSADIVSRRVIYVPHDMEIILRGKKI